MRLALAGFLVGCGFHGGSSAVDAPVVREIAGSLDAAPDASDATPDAPPDTPPQTTFVFEAEAATATSIGTGNGAQTFTWTTESDPAIAGYSGAGYLHLIPGDGGGCTPATLGSCATASYAVVIGMAGTYYLHVRGYATNTSNDSVYGGMDGAPTTSNPNGMAINGDGAWHWLTPLSFTLGVGPHTASLWQREAGVRVDMVVLSMTSADPALP